MYARDSPRHYSISVGAAARFTSSVIETDRILEIHRREKTREESAVSSPWGRGCSVRLRFGRPPKCVSGFSRANDPKKKKKVVVERSHGTTT